LVENPENELHPRVIVLNELEGTGLSPGCDMGAWELSVLP
jgi:hypothetical protein